MTNLTQVTLTGGIPVAGDGTVSTIDALMALFPGALGSGGGLKVDGSGTPLPVSGTITGQLVGHGGAVLDFAGQNAAAPANAVLIGGEFNTSPTTITSGNASPLQLDNAGNLLVNIKTGASSGAVAQGSTTSGQTGSLIQGAVTTASPGYTNGQTSPISLDAAGNLRVNVVTGSTSGSVAQGSTTSGQQGGLTQAAVTTAAPAYTAGQTSPLNMDAGGGLRVTTGDIGAGTGGSKTPRIIVDSSQIGSLGKQNDSGSVSIVYSSGSTLPARGHTAAPTPVADGSQVEIITDKVGKMIAVGSIRDLKGDSAITLTSSTAETTLIAAVPAAFIDLYGLIIANTSGTATEVIIRDATGGGTARSFMVPAGETRGFMLPEGGAIKQAAVNNNWTAQCVTSVASIKIDALYVQNV